MGKQIADEAHHPKTKAHRLDEAPEAVDSDKSTWPTVPTPLQRMELFISAISPTDSNKNNSLHISANTAMSLESK